MAHDDPHRPPRDLAGGALTIAGPLGRLTPYLDLFGRLDDEELARLAAVDVASVAGIRAQVLEVSARMAQWADLLTRLDDEQLARLTGTTLGTIRFWRACQRVDGPRLAPVQLPTPTVAVAPAPAVDTSAATSSHASARSTASSPPARPMGVPIASIRTKQRAVVVTSARGAKPAGDSPRKPTPRRPTPGPAVAAEEPVADWSDESPITFVASAASLAQLAVAASWDTTSPTAGMSTIVTPIDERPDTLWQRHAPAAEVDPSETDDDDR